MKKNILVTGANGFIGQRVVKLLASANYDVKAFVLPGEADSSLFPPAVELIQGDLTDFQKTYESTGDCSGVIHLAALVSDGGSELDHQRVTVGSTRNLFLAARPGTRVILASSITIYGDALGKLPCAETVEPGVAQGPYSRAKQAQESLAKTFLDNGGDVVILRPANVYGPGSGPWVKDVIEQLSSGLPALVDQGSGNAGLVCVDHVAQSMVNALDDTIKPGSVFNLCDELDVTWRQYFEDLAEIIQEKKPVSIPGPLAHILAAATEKAWSFFSMTSRPPLSKEALNLIGNDLKIPAAKSRKGLNLKNQKSYQQVLAEIKASLQ